MGKHRHLLSDINENTRTAHCAKCGYVKIRHKGRRPNGQIIWRCSIAHSYFNDREYPLPLDKYYELLENQGGVCGICEREPKLNEFFVVDHDHKTHEIRGLLCSWCNWKLGRLECFPIKWLSNALDWLTP